MTTIPKILKIGAHTYTIHVVTPPILTEDDASQGANCPKRNIIEINSSLAPSHQVVTLLHEILHTLNSELNHVVLDSLAEQLTQVLLDNDLLK
jgi:Zn-dependent peptidase ImmA (M78 family)